MKAGISCYLFVFQSKSFWTLQRSDLGLPMFGKMSLPTWMMFLSGFGNLSYPWLSPWEECGEYKCKGTASAKNFWTYSVKAHIYLLGDLFDSPTSCFSPLQLHMDPRFPLSSEPVALIDIFGFSSWPKTFCLVVWCYSLGLFIRVGHIFASPDSIWINKMLKNHLCGNGFEDGAMSCISCFFLLHQHSKDTEIWMYSMVLLNLPMDTA